MHGQFCIQNIPNCIIEHNKHNLKKQGTVEENGKQQKE